VVRHRGALGTPSAIVQKVQRDMAEALQSPDVQARLQDLGLEPVGNTPAEFRARIEAESRKWGAIVESAGIKAGQ
jgi:tripartite-type tricarboxylate transporter receptor subunit TctC